MKKSLLNIAIVALIALTTGCAEDAEKDISATALGAFETLYPNCNAKWDIQSGYEVAHFNHKDSNAETWFGKDGWVMTKTDVDYDSLPPKIKRGFNSSDYSKWEITSISKIERFGFENVYSIIAERNKVSYELYLNDDGTPVKISDITNAELSPLRYIPQPMPEKVAEAMSRKHPGSIIYDISRMKNVTEINFIENGIVKKAIFYNDGAWIITTYRISKTGINKNIMRSVRKNMPKHRIIEASLTESPSGKFYTIECESNNATQTFYFDGNGKIVDK